MKIIFCSSSTRLRLGQNKAKPQGASQETLQSVRSPGCLRPCGRVNDSAALYSVHHVKQRPELGQVIFKRSLLESW